MNKKQIMICAVAAVLIASGIGGYFFYKDYKKKHQPNIDIATMSDSIPEGEKTGYEDQVVKPKDPQYTDLSEDSTGLYPTLSGVYEEIWDGFELNPIDINAFGESNITASYRMIWSRKFLYVQVIVNDVTPDGYVKPEDGNITLYTKNVPDDVKNPNTLIKQDSVEFFINEDNNRNSKLLVGDCHYYISRTNDRLSGFGAVTDYQSVCYENYDEAGNTTGYTVEAALPLLTIKAQKNNSIGFEVKVNDVSDGNLVGIKKWASSYLYDFQNFKALGNVTFK